MLNDTKLYKKDIAGALMEMRFDPKEPGLNNIIARSATPDYCKARAAEILFSGPSSPEDFKQAIQILTMGYIIVKGDFNDASDNGPNQEE